MKKLKFKVLMISFLLAIIIFGTGITYSLFTSNSNFSMNQKIAKFVFNTKKTDSIEVPLSDIKPGDVKTFNFEVANSQDRIVSDVTVNYQIIVKTLHLMPLEIKLYKKGTKDELILNCDETFGRDKDNQLICNSNIQEMPNTIEKLDKYELQITYPEKYNNEMYEDLVDFIDIEIRSWQNAGK